MKKKRHIEIGKETTSESRISCYLKWLSALGKRNENKFNIDTFMYTFPNI